MPCRPMYMASVAAIGVKFANRIRVPLIPPTTNGAEKHQDKTRQRSSSVDLSSLMKNEATTTRKPDSGPTDRSMAPSNSAMVWPSAMNPRAVASSRILLILNADRKLVVLAEDIESQQNDDERKRNRGRVVRSARNGASAPWPSRAFSCSRQFRRARSAFTAAATISSLRDVAPGQRRDGAPAGQDDNLVAQALEFGCIRRVHDHRRARARYLTQDAVDFDARADIDTLRGLVGNDEARLGEQGARHHDLLLVAARQRQHWRLDARRLHRERVERRADLLQLLLPAHDAERWRICRARQTTRSRAR